jgi:putative lysine transport system permease protein
MLEFLSGLYAIIIRFWPSILLGVRTTITLAVIGTSLGLIIGLVVGGLKAIKPDHNSPSWVKAVKRIYDVLTSIYIEVFRGTPMMVQAVFIYYALLNVIHWDKLSAGLFVISINTGAYMSEIIRAGIQAVDPGQQEAARTLGMSNIQTMFYIILPQAIRNVFPAIGNELVVNIKDSSVLMIISITELMFQAKSIGGTTYKFTETYFLTAMVYLCLTLIASFILRKIEKRLNNRTTSLPQSDTDSTNMFIGVK